MNNHNFKTMDKTSSRLLHFKAQLGVFPISLMHNQPNVTKFALLNGLKNSLCVDFLNDLDKNQYRSYAWSANIHNFLSVNNDVAFLHNVARGNIEKIPYKAIEDNVEKFYEYIGQKSTNDDLSVINFILRTYRKLRSSLRECSGQDSLRAFMCLLSNIEDDNIDVNKWGLPSGALDVKNSINDSLWNELVGEIRTGVIGESLCPNVSLILRHTAGRLFEEANYIAQFPSQLDLFPSELIKYDYHPKQLGAFYTPSYIARTIVEESFLCHEILPDKIRIFDPACGAGEFLVESLRQLKAKGYVGKVEIIGWDIAQTAIDMANYVLVFEKREWGENLTITLENKNSIIDKWPDNIDFIFMNPPYASWEQMDSSTREQTQSIIGGKNGRPNLAAVFYFIAANALTNNGVLGCMVPSSLLSSDSHMNIRKSTNELIRPILIGRLGSYVFDNAFVDACMVVASAKPRSDSAKLIWTNNVENVVPKALRELRRQQVTQVVVNQEDYSIYSVPQVELRPEGSWMPMSYDSCKQKEVLELKIKDSSLVRISELFDVKQGARTGFNKVFIITSKQYEALPSKERKYFRPSIDSSSLRNGVLEKSNYLFFPYTIGLNELIDEDHLNTYIPTYYNNFLLPNKPRLIKRAGINSKNWWLLTRPRDWQKEMQPKLVSTEFGKAGNFSFDKLGDYVVERGCAWFAKDSDFNPDNYFAYLAMLNSSKMNDLLHIYSRQLAGGSWYALDAKNINRIPVPDFSNNIYDEYRMPLIDFGLKIINREQYDINELDKLVACIYSF